MTYNVFGGTQPTNRCQLSSFMACCQFTVFCIEFFTQNVSYKMAFADDDFVDTSGDVKTVADYYADVATEQ